MKKLIILASLVCGCGSVNASVGEVCVQETLQVPAPVEVPAAILEGVSVPEDLTVPEGMELPDVSWQSSIEKPIEIPSALTELDSVELELRSFSLVLNGAEVNSVQVNLITVLGGVVELVSYVKDGETPEVLEFDVSDRPVTKEDLDPTVGPVSLQLLLDSGLPTGMPSTVDTTTCLSAKASASKGAF
jgi:hypothetical protein